MHTMRIPDTGLSSHPPANQIVSSSHPFPTLIFHMSRLNTGPDAWWVRKGQMATGSLFANGHHLRCLTHLSMLLLLPVLVWWLCCVTHRRRGRRGRRRRREVMEKWGQTLGDQTTLWNRSCDAAPRTTSGHSLPGLEDNPSLILTGNPSAINWWVRCTQLTPCLKVDQLCSVAYVPEPSPNGLTQSYTWLETASWLDPSPSWSCFPLSLRFFSGESEVKMKFTQLCLTLCDPKSTVLINHVQNFPGGPVVKTPPCNLLQSMWNSAGCYMAAWMGGEFGGEWIHIYVWLSPFAVHLKLPQHCFFEFFTILFYVLVFGSQGMWVLSFPIRFLASQPIPMKP